MPEKYSDPNSGDSPAPGRSLEPRIFAIDSGSPRSSAALRWGDHVESLEFRVGDSSGRLLPDLDALLSSVGGSIEELNGLVALRGPGSFTGLRVGMATVLGLHQATGTPATAVTTFEALAWQARRRVGAASRPILAAIDALRGERFVQSFDGRTLRPLDSPSIVPDLDVASCAKVCVIGFGLTELEQSTGGLGPSSRLLEAEALAPDLVQLSAETGFVFDDSLLTEPLYLRPPAAAATGT